MQRSYDELDTKLNDALSWLIIDGAISRGKYRRALTRQRKRLTASIDTVVSSQLMAPAVHFNERRDWLTIWPTLCTNTKTIRHENERVLQLSLVVTGTLRGFPAERVCQVIDVGFCIRQHALTRTCQRLALTTHEDIVSVFAPVFDSLYVLAYMDMGNVTLPDGTAAKARQHVVPIGQAGGAVVDVYLQNGKVHGAVHTTLAPDQITPQQAREIQWWTDKIQGHKASVHALMALCVLGQYTLPSLMAVADELLNGQ